jgi:hypothetical protein
LKNPKTHSLDGIQYIHISSLSPWIFYPFIFEYEATIIYLWAVISQSIFCGIKPLLIRNFLLIQFPPETRKGQILLLSVTNININVKRIEHFRMLENCIFYLITISSSWWCLYLNNENKSFSIFPFLFPSLELMIYLQKDTRKWWKGYYLYLN